MTTYEAIKLVPALRSRWALAGCGEKKPPHYYVFCEDVDGRGWRLIDYEKNDQGYLMSCTFQSPDRQQVQTLRCRAEGCD